MSRSDLEICACHLDITPDGPEQLAGYQARGGLSAPPVPETLSASVTGLRQGGGEAVWLICLDTLFVDDAFVHDLAIRASAQNMSMARRPDLEAALTADRMIVVASHTHGAPNLLQEPITGCASAEGYRVRVLDVLAKTLAEMQAGTLVWRKVNRVTRADGPGPPSVNRRRVGLYLDRKARRLRWGAHYGHNHRGVRDPVLHGLTFHSEDGPTAVWWCFAAHPAFFPDVNAITADFPGDLRGHIRQESPNAAVSFLPGLCGSVIPGVTRYPDSGPFWRRLVSRLPLIPGLGGFTEDGYGRWCALLRTAWEGLSWHPLPERQALRLRRTRIANVFRAGDPALALEVVWLEVAGQVIVFLSGEPLAEWAPVLGPHLPADVLMSGYCAGPPAYIAPAACLGSSGYEVDGFQQAFGLSGRMSPAAEDHLIEALKTLSDGPKTDVMD